MSTYPDEQVSVSWNEGATEDSTVWNSDARVELAIQHIDDKWN